MESAMHDVNWRLPEHDDARGYLCEASHGLDFCGFFDFAERTSEESFHSVGGVSSFLHEEAKLRETIKLHSQGFDAKSDFYTEEDGQDMFDMSSFFREDMIRKHTEDLSRLGNDFDETTMELEKDPSHERTSSSMEEVTVEESSIDSVVMGIPYYVACQWQHMQQQQQQQQQAVMMLWWQAYLSGAYSMCGPKGATTASQLGWSLPSVAFQGAYTNFGEESLYQHLFAEDKNNQGGTKRRRKSDGNDQNGKKGRRQRHDERVCKNCGTNETPFWRKDKQDGHPLCNACGLYLSKNDAPRPKVLWKSGEKPTSMIQSTSTPIII